MKNGTVNLGITSSLDLQKVRTGNPGLKEGDFESVLEFGLKPAGQTEIACADTGFTSQLIRLSF